MKRFYAPLALAAALLASPAAFGAGFNSVTVDQGVLKVLFNKNVAGHSVGYKLPKGCSDTKVNIKEDEAKGTLAITHSGPTCPTGADFTLILGEEYQNKPIKLKLKAGVLQLPSEMKHYNKANITVSAGAVDSRNLKSYCARKLTNPAGVKCAFTAATKAKGKYDIDATVTAGVIKL